MLTLGSLRTTPFVYISFNSAGSPLVAGDLRWGYSVTLSRVLNSVAVWLIR